MEFVSLKQRAQVVGRWKAMLDTLKKTRFDASRRNAVWNMPLQFGPFPLLDSGQPSMTEDTDGVFDWIMVFVYSSQDLENWAPKAMKALAPNGLVWFCFPKKSSKIKTDINRDHGWEALTALQVRYVNLVSVDATWSGFGATHAATGQLEQREEKSKSRNEILGSYLDHETREMRYPEEMQTILDAHPAQKSFFLALSFTNRKEYLEWIVTAKRPETKAQRLGQLITYLAEGRKNPAGR